jgi:uncharacterized protein YqiB (DUF1249 family)
MPELTFASRRIEKQIKDIEEKSEKVKMQVRTINSCIGVTASHRYQQIIQIQSAAQPIQAS